MTPFQVPLIAVILAAAGVPLYIHLPRFAVGDLGLSLGTVGAILISIRVVDLVQDPFLGRLSDSAMVSRTRLAWIGLIGLAVGFLSVFTLTPVGATAWLMAGLVVVFSAYSLLYILFYATCVDVAQTRAGQHMRLAGLREAGMLGGIILAAILPQILSGIDGTDGGYRSFGWVLAALILAIGTLTRGFWTTPRRAAQPKDQLQLSLLKRPGIRGLLILGLINATPVAISSTLFLFFVEDVLILPDLAAVFLVAFFLAAGVSAPLWSALATRYGARPVLAGAMVASMAVFIWAATLGAGDVVQFSIICIGSGATLGADMVILPALFAARLAQNDHPRGAAFGLWSFVSKLALAVAAVAVLPALDLFGYEPLKTGEKSDVLPLTFAYAVLPCLVKIGALGVLLKLPKKVLIS